MSLDRKASIIPLPHLDMPMLLAVPGDYCIEFADSRGARMTMYTDMAYGSARVCAQPGSPPPMPVGDPEEIVAGLHSRIVSEVEAESGTDMGIIEVGTGITGEARREYSCFIMKVLFGTDLSYWLRLDLHAGDDIVRIEGLFEETGITGVRASMVMTNLLARGEVSVGTPEEGISGWASDPYDSEWRIGALMNRSEDEVFDSDFPGHPLTLARKFMRFLIDKN